jgi:hypothetical protein
MHHTQTITKLTAKTFRSLWLDQRGIEVPDSRIKLSFAPITETFQLSGSYCLLHWQAKPKGLRRFGVYCSTSDSYTAIDHDKLRINASGQSLTLQINETLHKTVPTAVLYYPHCQLIDKTDYFLIAPEIAPEIPMEVMGEV